MEGLLAQSAKSLEKGKAIDDGTTEKFTSKSPERESLHSKDSHLSSSPRFVEYAVDKDRSSLPREVMQALFPAPVRLEEKTQRKCLELGLNRKRAAGRSVVTKPLDDTLTPVYDISMITSDMKADVDDEYVALRKAVKVHLDAMKSYYEAAVDAFTKGDGLRAKYLLEQGKHHNQLAREADKRSAGEFVEARENIQAEVTLDLHTHSSKEAISILKLHLHSLASIPSFRYMKVIANTNDEDVTKGKRKKLSMEGLLAQSAKCLEKGKAIDDGTTEKLSSLAIEHDFYNLRKQVDEKDVTIKELTSAAHAARVTDSKLPFMVNNLLYDMSSSSPSSSDPDSPVQ